jgi:hypothetical protein
MPEIWTTISRWTTGWTNTTASANPVRTSRYIKRSAKASATGNSTLTKGGGDTAIGGFINKPGAKVGDVTIIFDGEDINAISE